MGSKFLISRVVGDRGEGYEVEDDREMISLKSTPWRRMDGLPSESQQALIDELSDLVSSLVIRIAVARPTRREWRDAVREQKESRKRFTQILQRFAREGMIEVQFQTGLKAGDNFAYAIGLKHIPCLEINFADENFLEPGVNWRTFLESKGTKGMRVRTIAHEAFSLTPLQFVDSRGGSRKRSWAGEPSMLGKSAPRCGLTWARGSVGRRLRSRELNQRQVPQRGRSLAIRFSKAQPNSIHALLVCW